MQQDIRGTQEFQAAEALYRKLLAPGTGLISDAAELTSNGQQVAFTGTAAESLEGVPATRICITDIASHDTRVATFGPHFDKSPKYSPDGRQIAFLSDRQASGKFQLYLLDPRSGIARAAPHVEGWAEYLHWSPDGTRILLGVAGHGADTAAVHGGMPSRSATSPPPSWMPQVQTTEEAFRRRRLWIYEIATDRVQLAHPAPDNVWEACWCGNQAIVAICSDGPEESDWYDAQVRLLHLVAPSVQKVYVPEFQMGVPAASPSGRYLAFVEALCSDRWLVAGDLRVLDMPSAVVRRPDTLGVDVTYLEWRSDRHLLVAGHRGRETVVGLYDVTAEAFSELWHSGDESTGGRYATVAGIGEKGDFALACESFLQPPEIAVIEQGHYRGLTRCGVGIPMGATVAPAVEHVSWSGRDGLQLQGWLLRPPGKGPHPLVMNIHGGPVWHWRPTWLGRGGVPTLLLLQNGYAVFLPNPRGSSGRGQAFARHVLGDTTGADTQDYLTGVDHLVKAGWADPNRLGITGVSYGGYMACWLITQDSRFTAAVPVAPIANPVTAHLLSNIPRFISLFLADTYTNVGGKYFSRSPVMFSKNVKTPTLLICGALDRCTPAAEAAQFNAALMEAGVRSVLVTYPEEGHGIRKLPAAIDYAARLLAWFQHYMYTPDRSDPVT